MPMGYGSEGHGFSRAGERAFFFSVFLDCFAIKENRSIFLRELQTNWQLSGVSWGLI
jgi:hypothetical protein